MLLQQYSDNVFDQKDQFAFLIACLCHDLGHDGRTNMFHINTSSPLAVLYNDQSPLENHHAHQAFLLIIEHGILEQLDLEVRIHMRQVIIRCILATDLAKHVIILGKYDEIEVIQESEDRIRCLEMIMKCADISNVIRPQSLAELWGHKIQVNVIHIGRDVLAGR